MMTLLTAERIKLFSIRAPWWCAAIALVISLGFAALFVGLAGDQFDVDVGATQSGAGVGRAVILVLAVLVTTTEYQWKTIRTTFQAVPARTPALLAKAAVVGGWCAVVGLVIGFGSWALSTVLAPNVDLALDSAADWRSVAGQGAVYLLTGILGVGVGLLLRNTAAALAVALIWTQLIEGLVVLIPGVGTDIYTWMPFFAAGQFLGSGSTMTGPLNLGELPLDPLGYGAYFAAVCVALFAAGLALAKRRDV